MIMERSHYVDAVLWDSPDGKRGTIKHRIDQLQALSEEKSELSTGNK